MVTLSTKLERKTFSQHCLLDWENAHTALKGGCLYSFESEELSQGCHTVNAYKLVITYVHQIYDKNEVNNVHKQNKSLY